MTATAWAFLDDERRGLRVPEEWVARGTIELPSRPASCVLAVPSEGLMPSPSQPRLYRKSHPARYEHVVTEKRVVREGEPLGGDGATCIPYASAVVFERVG